MRLFIAIRLSEEMRSSLLGTLHDLKKKGVRGSYVPGQNLHLTLTFIGETKETAAVKAAMDEVSWKPFKLSFSEMGSFGDLLYAGCKGNQGLNGFVRDLRTALDAQGIAYDRKKFVPHITLIRKCGGRWQDTPAPKGEMMVRSISLMKSAEKDGKRIYTEVYSVKK